MGVSAEEDKYVDKGGVVIHLPCAWRRQLVLTVNHHVDRVLCDISPSHHHAGEGPLIGQLGIGQQQAGVCHHAHAAFVFIVGDDGSVLAALLDEQVPRKPVAFVLGTKKRRDLFEACHTHTHTPLASSTNQSIQSVAERPLCHMEARMRGLIRSPMHLDGAWLADKWVSERFLKLSTSPATYIFPFGELDVFCFVGAGVAGDDQRSSILAVDGFETAGCGTQRHICQLDGQRRRLSLILTRCIHVFALSINANTFVRLLLILQLPK